MGKGCGYGMMKRKRPAQEIEGARSFIHPYCLSFIRFLTIRAQGIVVAKKNNRRKGVIIKTG